MKNQIHGPDENGDIMLERQEQKVAKDNQMVSAQVILSGGDGSHNIRKAIKNNRGYDNNLKGGHNYNPMQQA